MLAERPKREFDNIIIVTTNALGFLDYRCRTICRLGRSDLTPKYVSFFSKLFTSSSYFSITICSCKPVAKDIQELHQKSNLPIPTTGLGLGILKSSILIIGFLISQVLGVSITPLLTALGVGGLAVALLSRIRSASICWLSSYLMRDLSEWEIS